MLLMFLKNDSFGVVDQEMVYVDILYVICIL